MKSRRRWNAGRTAEFRQKAFNSLPTILKYTAIGLAICILPLFIVGTLDPKSNPVGLGLLMVMGTPVVLSVAVVAIAVRLIVDWARRR